MRTVVPFRIGPHAHRPRLCRARTVKPSLSLYSLRKVCRCRQHQRRSIRCTICCCRQFNCATIAARCSAPHRTGTVNQRRCAALQQRDGTAPPALVSRSTCSRGLPKNIRPSAASTPGGACVGIPGLMSFGNVVTSLGAWPSPIALIHSRVPQRLTPHGMYCKDSMAHLMHASLVASTRVTPSSAT